MEWWRLLKLGSDHGDGAKRGVLSWDMEVVG